MTKITLNAIISGILHNLTQPVELCDEGGIVIGRFIPQVSRAEIADPDPKISNDDLKERAKSTEWFSTAEVLARLEQR